MAGLVLKEYQRECLEALGGYFRKVRELNEAGVRRPDRDAYEEVTGRDYFTVEQFSGIPYVCLRVPTGGGKTLLGAHLVGRVGRELLHRDHPVCLWVTHTTTIRDQTLRGLKDRSHPYYAALRDSVKGGVEVLTMEEAKAGGHALRSGKAVVIVTTIQSYRRDKEDNLSVYQDNGYLMEHIDQLPAERKQLLEKEDGRVAYSLANVLRSKDLIVIIDEAHSARSEISFDSLARFGPRAVIELTATPKHEHDPERGEYASNVVHAVSALQLYREGMIKLPVELESREEWLAVLEGVIEKRVGLEKVARVYEERSGRFIRPVALIQAQPNSRTRETHTVEKVKEALIEQFGIDRVAVRIETGTVHELGDTDLQARDCNVEYVVTVDKLREGWDCPFAYVLGSLGNVATETAVEQILGRVLRMPDAEPTDMAELNRAYAVVQSENVLATASKLRDGLVKRCGFDADSVKDAFRVKRLSGGQKRMPIGGIYLDESPDFGLLSREVSRKVEYEEGEGRLIVKERLTRDETEELRDATQTLPDRAAVEEFWNLEREVGTVGKALDDYAEVIRIPQLAVRDGERSYLFEPRELEEFSWSLDECDAEIGEDEFDLVWKAGDRVLIDADEEGRTTIGKREEILVRQMDLGWEGGDWSEVELIRWLNEELHRGQRFGGLTAMESLAWLKRMVGYLVKVREADLGILVRKRHELADVVIPRIAEHGRRQVRKVGEMLIAGEGSTKLETSFEHLFEIEEQVYSPYHLYEGGYELEKHAFDMRGSMNVEEAECAKRINDHDNVRRWVRNMEHEGSGGFSLPLSPGRFFPDFVCELEDGRIGLVEYKGRHRMELAEELHKKAVGELWERQSEGKAVFIWVADEDWGALEAGLVEKG